jgi:pyrimidine-nucleoside phosphorylase
MGFEQFRKLVKNQGGDVSFIDDQGKFPVAPFFHEILSPREGYLHAVDALTIGETSVEMGAGRARKEDSIDHRVGIIVHHKVGQFISKGDCLFTLHANSESSLESARDRVMKSIHWSDEKCAPLPLLYEVIS